MLVCDKCGAGIEDGSKFCAQCGDPVTEADRVRVSVANSRAQMSAEVEMPKGDSTTEISIVCPKCDRQNSQQIDLEHSSQSMQCPDCNKSFKSRIVKIRAKRSKQSKKENKRDYSVRVTEADGREDLIEFTDASLYDFELRSGDAAIFSYIDEKLKVVQNLSISKYLSVRSPSCFITTYYFGVGSHEANTLRWFRDKYLERHVPFIVNFYYNNSPKLIKEFEKRDWLDRLARPLNIRLLKALTTVLNCLRKNSL